MTEENKEEDWMKYANSGFGQTNYSLWDEVVEEEEEEEEDEEEQEIEDFDLTVQLDSHMEEIPRAPDPAGLKHLVRIGCCNPCLGRLGGKKRYEQSIEQSGEEIRGIVEKGNSHLTKVREEIPLCPFCENLFEEVDLLTDIIYDSISPYQFKRLQLGARFPKSQIEEEDSQRKRYGSGGCDGLKTGLVAEIAKRLNQRLEGVTLVNDKPQILALIDVLTLSVDLDVRAHYMYGRYRKLERGIPQTRWPCRACKGRGCERCEMTGLQYQKSVQDLIGNPLLSVFGSKEHAFHGMGREDIDVRCMGRGRPFVIEMKEPRLRIADPVELMKMINDNAEGSIDITSLRDSTRSEVVRLKETPAEKSYTIRFKLMPLNEAEYTVLTAPLDLTKENKGRSKNKRKRRGDNKRDNTKPLPTEIETENIKPGKDKLSTMKKAELVALCVEYGVKKSGTKDELIERILNVEEPVVETFDLPEDDFIIKSILSLEGVKLAQRTPERVAHRRADLVRRRTVFEVHQPVVEMMEDGSREIEVTMRCESGTYVKETVHGDSGRTQPSIASLLKAKCEVIWLDVGDIHAD
ncbi:MAG: tRNA pseudouridine(54/55) synthase Pus10 [Candidatus Poseidoniaceae archaeon]|nr:tRNA pseudouridine(54/55) synthase Pus10 [Candidatus Poseidoniaceae archaeon]